MVDDAGAAPVPPSITALLAAPASIDRLPAAERDLLERVSVVGLDVTTAESRALCERDDVDTILDALTHSRDLLVRDGAGGWEFQSIIIRDAAYDAMPKALRAELHERFADALADPGSLAGADAGAEQLAPSSGTTSSRPWCCVETSGRSTPRSSRCSTALRRHSSTPRWDARDRDDYIGSLRLADRGIALEPTSGAAARPAGGCPGDPCGGGLHRG